MGLGPREDGHRGEAGHLGPGVSEPTRAKHVQAEVEVSEVLLGKDL